MEVIGEEVLKNSISELLGLIFLGGAAGEEGGGAMPRPPSLNEKSGYGPAVATDVIFVYSVYFSVFHSRFSLVLKGIVIKVCFCSIK